MCFGLKIENPTNGTQKQNPRYNPLIEMQCSGGKDGLFKKPSLINVTSQLDIHIREKNNLDPCPQNHIQKSILRTGENICNTNI